MEQGVRSRGAWVTWICSSGHGEDVGRSETARGNIVCVCVCACVCVGRVRGAEEEEEEE